MERDHTSITTIYKWITGRVYDLDRYFSKNSDPKEILLTGVEKNVKSMTHRLFSSCLPQGNSRDFFNSYKTIGSIYWHLDIVSWIPQSCYLHCHSHLWLTTLILVYLTLMVFLDSVLTLIFFFFLLFVVVEVYGLIIHSMWCERQKTKTLVTKMTFLSVRERKKFSKVQTCANTT